MIAGWYGFDEVLEYCWYETRNIPEKTVFLRVMLTYDIWVFIPLLYLVVAVILITYSLFSPRSLLSSMGARQHLDRHPSHAHSVSSTNIAATLAATLARRDVARRALTARVLGYIIVPIICVVPGVAADVIARARPDITVPSLVTLISAITAGLMGTFNAILLSLDPSIIAVVFAQRVQARRDTRRRKRVPSREEAQVLGGDVEMENSKVIGPIEESRTAKASFVRFDMANNQSLEHQEQLTPDGVLDGGRDSTGTQNSSELADTYHGL